MIKVIKSDKVEVRADVIEWPLKSGTQVLDIRTYVKTAKSGQKFIPTGKGVQIPLDESERFARRLLKMVKDRVETTDE